MTSLQLLGPNGMDPTNEASKQVMKTTMALKD